VTFATSFPVLADFAVTVEPSLRFRVRHMVVPAGRYCTVATWFARTAPPGIRVT
jgi:hypothetical protein